MNWNDLYQMIPLQLRTLGEAVSGNTSPITRENFSEADIGRLEDVIAADRAYKQGLLDQFHGQENTDMDNYAFNQYKKHFYNQDKTAIDEDKVKRFMSGSGSVRDYDAYYNANQGGSRGDLDISPSASIMNTLGQFTYDYNPDGTYTITDKYDFENDYNARVMPRELADTRRYENLSNIEKLKLLAKETWQMPGKQADLSMGIASLPSRFGNAFVGRENARPVNFRFTSSRDLNPTPEVLDDQRKAILQQILGNY